VETNVKRFFLIGASAAALVAMPAIAQPEPPAAPASLAAAPMGPGPMQHGRRDAPQTRADIEKRIAERFAKADTNKDGAVTEAELKAAADARRAEIQAKMAEVRTRMFTAMDSDRNGQISRQEWDAHHAEMQAKRTERRETVRADGPRGPGDKDRGPGIRMKGGKDGRDMGHRMMMRHDRDGLGWSGAWIRMADTNTDGRVTLAEAQARPLARFDAVDTNKDGTLSPEERKAAHAAKRAEHRAERKARRGQS
jgi:Ca2+-binding EF-hand superfamily protein